MTKSRRSDHLTSRSDCKTPPVLDWWNAPQWTPNTLLLPTACTPNKMVNSKTMLAAARRRQHLQLRKQQLLGPLQINAPQSAIQASAARRQLSSWERSIWRHSRNGLRVLTFLTTFSEETLTDLVIQINWTLDIESINENKYIGYYHLLHEISEIDLDYK